jgi:hypothetical protein
VSQDPDCGCQDGNGCCGVSCNSLNDNDCPQFCGDGRITGTEQCELDNDCPCWQKCGLPTSLNPCTCVNLNPTGCEYYDACVGSNCNNGACTVPGCLSDPHYCLNADPILCSDDYSRCHVVSSC